MRSMGGSCGGRRAFVQRGVPPLGAPGAARLAADRAAGNVASASAFGERNKLNSQALASDATIMSWPMTTGRPRRSGRIWGARRMAVPIQRKEMLVLPMSNPPNAIGRRVRHNADTTMARGHVRMWVYRSNRVNVLTEIPAKSSESSKSLQIACNSLSPLARDCAAAACAQLAGIRASSGRRRILADLRAAGPGLAFGCLPCLGLM